MAVSEADVGIRAWTNDLKGFTGILKQRYTDFKVNELTVHGEVVRLTDTKAVTQPLPPPPKPAAAAAGAPAEPAGGADAGYPQEGVDAALAEFAALAGDANGALLREYVAAVLGRATAAPGSGGGAGGGGPSADLAAADGGLTAAAATPEAAEPASGAADPAATGAAAEAAAAEPAATAGSSGAHTAGGGRGGGGGQGGGGRGSGSGRGSGAPRAPKHVLLEPMPEKQKRSAVHAFFKTEARLPPMRTETAPSSVKTGNHTAPSEGVIQVSAAPKRKRSGGGGGGGGGRGGCRENWPGGDARYVRFVMRKENMDTQAALSVLARMLHCSAGVFGFAGTKDKRAITEQAATAFKVADARLAGLNRSLRGIQLGNFSYVGEPLGLGASGGNQFDLVLRGVAGADAAQVSAAVEGLAKDGFVNYFGLQRFGSGASATHRVGALLLNGKWEAGARLILAGQQNDRPDIAVARAAFLERGDVAAALNGLPRFLTAECAILGGLQAHPGNWLTALECIPRSMRMMYVHAYQSYLWNAAASHRIERHGAGTVIAGDLVLPAAAAAAADDGGGDAAEAAAPDAEGPEAGGMRAAGRLAAVHTVTAEEAEAGSYDIEDVVLPLPGARVRYPEHDTAQVYAELAARDGVSLESSPHGTRGFSITGLAGDYRRLVQRPRALAWRLLRYAAPDAELSGVGTSGSPGVAIAAASENFSSGEGAPADAASGVATELAAAPAAVPESSLQSLALQLRFQLPPSAYATMAVRQATKGSTATSEHRSATLAAIAEAAAPTAAQNGAAAAGEAEAAALAPAAQSGGPAAESTEAAAPVAAQSSGGNSSGGAADTKA